MFPAIPPFQNSRKCLGNFPAQPKQNIFAQKNTIQRKVEGKLFEAELRLEERRNQLLSKLIEEDAQYARELEVHYRGESFIERQAKMRQRAKELADKRETERLKIVSEKNEQKWRQECVELRPVLSRRMQDQVCAARKHQIETKVFYLKNIFLN